MGAEELDKRPDPSGSSGESQGTAEDLEEWPGNKGRHRALFVIVAVVALLVVLVLVVVALGSDQTTRATNPASECKKYPSEPFAYKDGCQPWVGIREKLADLKMRQGLTLLADQSIGEKPSIFFPCGNIRCPVVQRYYASQDDIEPTCKAVAAALEAWGATTSPPDVTKTSATMCVMSAEKSRLHFLVQVQERFDIEDSQGRESPITAPHRSLVSMEVEPF